MTLLLVCWFAAGAVVGSLFGHGPHRDLDLLRCYAKPSTSVWDGEAWYRRAKRMDYDSTLVCLPRDGCTLAPNGDAVCWRVVKVKPR